MTMWWIYLMHCRYFLFFHNNHNNNYKTTTIQELFNNSFKFMKNVAAKYFCLKFIPIVLQNKICCWCYLPLNMFFVYFFNLIFYFIFNITTKTTNIHTYIIYTHIYCYLLLFWRYTVTRQLYTHIHPLLSSKVKHCRCWLSSLLLKIVVHLGNPWWGNEVGRWCGGLNEW